MLNLSQKQMDAIGGRARARLPDRISAHWAEQHPRLVRCFTEEELALIAVRVVDLATADRPQASEADVALAADLWLHELARRRRFTRP